MKQHKGESKALKIVRASERVRGILFGELKEMREHLAFQSVFALPEIHTKTDALGKLSRRLKLDCLELAEIILSAERAASRGYHWRPHQTAAAGLLALAKLRESDLRRNQGKNPKYEPDTEQELKDRKQRDVHQTFAILEAAALTGDLKFWRKLADELDNVTKSPLKSRKRGGGPIWRSSVIEHWAPFNRAVSIVSPEHASEEYPSVAIIGPDGLPLESTNATIKRRCFVGLAYMTPATQMQFLIHLLGNSAAPSKQDLKNFIKSQRLVSAANRFDSLRPG